MNVRILLACLFAPLAALAADKLKEMLALLDAQLAKDDKVMPADLKGLPH